MVSWTPPAAESTAVTGYRISYGDRYAQQLPAEQTSHELQDLEPSTEYTFELRSFNDAGESDPILETVTTLEQGQCHMYIQIKRRMLSTFFSLFFVGGGHVMALH